MRRFSFSLESVRSLRARVEEQALELLARELALQAERQAELRSAADRLAAAFAGAPAPGVAHTGSTLAVRDAFVGAREQERRAALLGAVAQEREVEACRDRLADAARDRQAVDRLRQRRLDRHMREAARAEQAALDDLAGRAAAWGATA